MSYLQFIDYGNSAHPLKVISFHGFPAVRSKQNREIADYVASELNARVRVVLYPGLSCDGTFSFKKTIRAMIDEFPKISSDLNKPQKIDLIGHSFGGFSSILLASIYPDLVRKMVLMSPLLRFASSVEQAQEFFSSILKDTTGIKTLPPEQLAGEFQELSNEYKVEDLIKKLDPSIQIKFLQARSDQVTPTKFAEELKENFKGSFEYELVDQDHSFLRDRKGLSHEIARFLM